MPHSGKKLPTKKPSFRAVPTPCLVRSKAMRDAKHFGYELAERMVNRMRARNVKAEQALRRVASEVAGRANTMVLAEGKHRGDVVGWVGEVQLACVERIAEHLSAADDDFCHSDLHQAPQKLAEVPSVSPGD